MALTNMKRSPTQEGTILAEAKQEGPEYPYGLRINLEAEDLAKLGIKDLPKVGSTISLVAKATVSDIGMNAHEGDQQERKHVGLQITDMSLDGKEKADPEAEKLYGGRDEGGQTVVMEDM